MTSPADQHQPHGSADPSATGSGNGAHRALITLIGAAAAALVLLMTPYFEGEVRHGYVDAGGVVTACVGHTLTAELSRTYTHAECQALLARDLVSHARPVLGCLRVPVAPHTLAALVDLAFNVGPGAVCRSSVVALINAGRLADGCRRILQYVYVAGRDCRLAASRCSGIVKRREAEARLCAAPPTGEEPYL